LAFGAFERIDRDMNEPDQSPAPDTDGRLEGCLLAVVINRPDAPIETFGRTARGFNVDAGTVNTTEFERLVTHADGAVGVHISQQPSHLPFSKGSK
jgi:hypothetical protein